MAINCRFFTEHRFFYLLIPTKEKPQYDLNEAELHTLNSISQNKDIVIQKAGKAIPQSLLTKMTARIKRKV